MREVASSRASPYQVAAYYDRKHAEYEAKYGNGPFTHAHTALYAQREFPLLHGETPLAPLGLTAIRQLLVAGQMAAMRRAVEAFSQEARRLGPEFELLDCGAGHGGTALWAALNYGWRVHALVLSDRQAEHIRGWATRTAVQDLIEVEMSELRESTIPERDYDAIVAIDTLAQIGRWEDTVDLLRSRLRERNGAGRLVMLDPFIRDSADPFAAQFNSYWRSSITPVGVVDSYTAKHGADSSTSVDLTQEQIPFWRLSIAYSSLQLEAGALDERERERLETSRSMHEDTLDAFRGGRMAYRLTVLGPG